MARLHCELTVLALIGLIVAAQPSAPNLLWQKKVGAGFAGPVVADGKLLLFHRLGNAEVLSG